MSEVTLHAQGAITGAGKLQPNVQAVTTPEDITFAQQHGITDINNRRDQPIKLGDGSTVFISNNQLQTIKEGLQRNPAAYPEIAQDVRAGLVAAPRPAAPPAPTAPPPPAGPQLPSQEEIQAQFANAVDDYQKQGGTLSSSAGQYDTANLARHLFYHGNQFEDSSTIPKDHTTGQEYALMKAIEAEFKKNGGAKLNPGDIMKLALKLNNGDTFKATLTAQNTLRALGRGREISYGEQAPKGSQDWAKFGTDIGMGRDFFQKYLMPIREPIVGPTNPATVDSDSQFARESGAWYHMFCTATIAQKSGGTAAFTAVMGEEAYVKAFHGGRDSQEKHFDMTGIGLGEHLTRQQDTTSIRASTDQAPDGTSPPSISTAAQPEGTKLTQNPWNAAVTAFTGDTSGIKKNPVTYNGASVYISDSQWNELHDFLQKFPGNPTDVYPGLDPNIAAAIKANKK